VRTSTLVLLLVRAQGHLLAAGERERAERVWGEIEALGAHTRDVVALLWPAQQEALRAGLDGELERTVELSQRIVSRAEELGIARAGQDAAHQIAFEPLLWLGRASEIFDSPLIREWRTAGLGRGSDNRTAHLLAHMGRTTEAQPLIKDYIARVPSLDATEALSTAGCLRALEVAVLVGDTEGVAAARDPLRGLVGAVDTGLVPINVARRLGQAAALLGEREAAREAYERSLNWAAGLRHRPEIALTRFAIAELLLSGSADERAEAQEHLDFAIEEFRAMKMQPSLERALRHKGLLHA
jgi:tetratricopeptide (TPR) repeat protein